MSKYLGFRKKKNNDTEAVVADAMKEVQMAMREVAEATAPLRKMSQKNLEDYEADSLPCTETGPKIQAKGGGIQIKKPGLFGSSKTVINIRSAQNVQIGNNNTMIINSSGRQRRNRDISPPPTAKSSRVDKERVKQVLGSNRVVNDAELLMVSTTFMGKQWRRILRHVGLEDVELDSKHLDYNSQGIKEVTYQCLKHWKQKMADLATVGTLASAICKVFSEDEVCDKFSP